MFALRSHIHRITRAWYSTCRRSSEHQQAANSSDLFAARWYWDTTAHSHRFDHLDNRRSSVCTLSCEVRCALYPSLFRTWGKMAALSQLAPGWRAGVSEHVVLL